MNTDTKKILVIDDSALMRRVICDIINSDKRFQAVAKASDGLEALELLRVNQYDGVVLDINMPRMNGLELLAKLKEEKIAVRVLVFSTDTVEGAQVTMDALELGAQDFIQKPGSSLEVRGEKYMHRFLELLYTVCGSKQSIGSTIARTHQKEIQRPFVKKPAERVNGEKIVAIASSTGGPKALQSVLPLLPENLDAPVVLVQHMPGGFTASLAERLNGMCRIRVKEAEEGEVLQKGVAYISMGGRHMNILETAGGRRVIHYTDQPQREGVRPSANYMYESLMETGYAEAVCVVLTGMGMDGTEGICNLSKKKKLYVIAQDQATSVVYGMPKGVVNAGMTDEEIPLNDIAARITERVGIRVAGK